MKAGQVLAMVQPHLAGTELLTLVSTQQQILALEMELTVKAAEAEAEAIRARAAFTQAEQALRRTRAYASKTRNPRGNWRKPSLPSARRRQT